MKVRAMVTFGGQYGMTKGQTDDLPENAVTQLLIQEGYLAVEVDGVAVEDMTKAQLIDALEGSGHDEHGEAE